jgi:hypothetical protein
VVQWEEKTMQDRASAAAQITAHRCTLDKLEDALHNVPAALVDWHRACRASSDTRAGAQFGTGSCARQAVTHEQLHKSAQGVPTSKQ